jgi:hypothetical protein
MSRFALLLSNPGWMACYIDAWRGLGRAAAVSGDARCRAPFKPIGINSPRFFMLTLSDKRVEPRKRYGARALTTPVTFISGRES